MALCYDYLKCSILLIVLIIVVLILVSVCAFSMYHCEMKCEINQLYSYYMFALIQLIGYYDLG